MSITSNRWHFTEWKNGVYKILDSPRCHNWRIKLDTIPNIKSQGRKIIESSKSSEFYSYFYFVRQPIHYQDSPGQDGQIPGTVFGRPRSRTGLANRYNDVLQRPVHDPTDRVLSLRPWLQSDHELTGHVWSWKEQLERSLSWKVLCWKVLSKLLLIHGRSFSWKLLSNLKLSNLTIFPTSLSNYT